MNLSLIDLYGTMGGFTKGIIYTLAIISIWSLTVMIQKWWYLRSAQAQTLGEGLSSYRNFNSKTRRQRQHAHRHYQLDVQARGARRIRGDNKYGPRTT